MRFKEAKGQKVMSTGSATTVGKVDGFLVDPVTRSVAALHLKKTEGEGDTLPWSDLKAFGRDAVTIEDAALIVVADGRLAELAGKDREVLGRRVLTEGGEDLGTVEDVDFDPADGRIVALLTKQHEVAGSRLIGSGSYAVVVRNA